MSPKRYAPGDSSKIQACMAATLQGPSSDHDGQGVGHDPKRQHACGADDVSVQLDRQQLGQRHLESGGAALADAWMREVGTVMKSTAHLQPVGHTQAGL